MAKKKVEINNSNKLSIFDLAKKLSNLGIIDEINISETNEKIKIKDWISTGNYLLNAQISSSLEKGIPAGRTIILSGASGTGKTFLSLNIAKNAQKKGYKVLWIDTEKAVDDLTFERFGIDMTSIVYIDSIETVNSLSTFLLNFVDTIQKAKEDNIEVDKYIVVIDSLANLSTDKEIKDVQTGSDKADMTRPKELRRLFRVCTSKLGRMDIPVIITNHVYSSIDMFTHGNVMSGGGGPEYNGSIIVELFKSQLKENTDSATTGIIVRSVIKKSRFSKSNIPVRFHISFYKGMNPYVGLDEYISWDDCGIDWGKYEKGQFEPTTTGRTIAVKHLEKHIQPRELFTSKVFTKDVIKELDKKISKVFELPKSSDIEIELDDLNINIEQEINEIRDSE